MKPRPNVLHTSINNCCTLNCIYIFYNQLIVWDVKNRRPLYCQPTCGGYVYCARTSPIDPGKVVYSLVLSSTPHKNHAKCDSWLESLHIFIFLIFCLKCYSKQKLTRGFSYNPCSYEIKIIYNAMQNSKLRDNCKYNRNCWIYNVDYILRADGWESIIINFII